MHRLKIPQSYNSAELRDGNFITSRPNFTKAQNSSACSLVLQKHRRRLLKSSERGLLEGSVG